MKIKAVQADPRLPRLARLYIIFTIAAAVCWVHSPFSGFCKVLIESQELDQVFCEVFHATVNLELHGWWHFLTAFASYVGCLYTLICYYVLRGRKVSIRLPFGLPVISSITN